MLKEIIVLAAFTLSLAGIASSLVVIQRDAQRQGVEVVNVLEAANEID